MSKPITCVSRNAREYFSSRAAKGEQNVVCWETALTNISQKLLKDAGAWEVSESEPLFYFEEYENPSYFGTQFAVGKMQLWLYKNRIFFEDDDLDFTLEERKLLVREEFDKERRQFEKLHAKFSGISNASQVRSKIPSNVRIFVWQRDSGKCVECGSNESLEYDHIIPFAKGGSNTERNLQLLCGNCNRLKSDNIQ